MKGMMSILLIAFVSVSLAGCAGKEKMCGYTKDYSCPNYGNRICGPKIKYKCDYICDNCYGKEEACQACWACIKSD